MHILGRKADIQPDWQYCLCVTDHFRLENNTTLVVFQHEYQSRCFLWYCKTIPSSLLPVHASVLYILSWKSTREP